MFRERVRRNLKWSRKRDGLEMISAVGVANLVILQEYDRVVAYRSGAVQKGNRIVPVYLISVDMTMENVANPKRFEQPQRLRPAPHSHSV